MIVRRALWVLLIICLGCSAQAPPAAPSPSAAGAYPPDVVRAVDRQVHAHYSLPPDIKVIMGPPRPSEFPNYDAITILFDSGDKKQSYEFLLSHDHKSLIRISKIDLTKDPYSEVMKKIDVAGRPTRGNKDAKVVVVSYDDFECPFCAEMHATLFPGILKEYGDRVLFIYKDYPLEEIHPWAIHAAVNANCLAVQSIDAYWDYADSLHVSARSLNAKSRADQKSELDKLATLNGQRHNLDDSRLQACVKTQDEKSVRASMNEGDAVGVNATPTLFINGQKMDGVAPASEIRAALDQALKDAGVAAPEHKAVPSETKGSAAAPSK